METICLTQFCDKIKREIRQNRLTFAEIQIKQSMGQFPDSSVPHNLYGILCEKKGEHAKAMNHFRAALALQPQDRAAAYNLELFGRHSGKKTPAFSEKDLGLFHRITDHILMAGQVG